MSNNIVEIILKLTDNASGELAGVSKKFQAVGDKLTRAGKAMTLGVTAPLVAAGGSDVSWGPCWSIFHHRRDSQSRCQCGRFVPRPKVEPG